MHTTQGLYRRIRCQISRIAGESRPQYTPNPLEDLLPLKAQRATRAIQATADREILRGVYRMRRQLYWRRYGFNCSTKMVTPQAGLVNSCGVGQCIWYVWHLESDIGALLLTTSPRIEDDEPVAWEQDHCHRQ